jgi:flagella basal body P-ring formation protein FlgA
LIRSLTIAALASLFATSAFAAPEAGQLSKSLSRVVSERFELPASATVRLIDVRIGNRTSYDASSSIEAVELTARARLNGILAAKVVVSGKETSSLVWVRFRTIVQVPVVTVTRDLDRNHKIAPEDLALSKRTITSNRPYYNVKDAVGRATKSALLRGELLHVRNTKSSATVKRGDRVGVLIRRGVVAIQTSGELLTSGSVGDSIRVRISSTGKTVAALVKGEGIVEVLR